MPRTHLDNTSQRLLAAGAAVFGRLGYRAATVRAIVARAGANLGAVNYHFGGKLAFYTAVLQHCLDDAIRRYPPDLDAPPGAPPEARLRAFVRATLLRLGEEQGCIGPLMARECADPTPALDAVVHSAMQPLAEHLAQLVRELAPDLDEGERRLACLSIVGQCFLWGFGRPLLVRLPAFPALPDVETLADHITRFSLAGLRAEPGRGTDVP